MDRKYGWRRGIPDQRDLKYEVPQHLKFIPLPPLVDLRPNFPDVYNQLDLGSCTANALAGNYQFDEIKQKNTSWMPSRLFIYYNERSLEGTIKSDAGAEIKDGIKSLNRWGVCPEDTWPYDTSKFAKKPLSSCYGQATKGKISQYLNLDNTDITHLKACLADNFPFVFGFAVYDSFEGEEIAKTGMMPMPAPTESLLGGHAVCCCGYDDVKQVFIVRNSWGADWGDKGYFYMPYQFMTSTDYCSDFWTIRYIVLK
jgi:C1A family cysteine protease